MVNLSLILISVLGGYSFLSQFNATKFELVRQSGHILVFECAVIGFIFLMLARIFTFVFELISPIPMLEFLHQLSIFEYMGTTIWAILLALLFAKIGNRISNLDEYAHAKIAAQNHGDLLERTLQQCLEKILPVEVTMRNDTSYIGLVRISGVITPREPDISLMLLASGYRDKDTRDLIISQDYTKAFEQTENKTFSDFQTILPISEIVSVRSYILAD